MAKRFFASEIWEEDWFLDMPSEYRQFWFYMIGKCDHAGIFRVNLKSARGRIEGDLRSTKALDLINNGKQRVRVLKDDVWFIEDFFVFQYGPKFNINNKVHESIAKVYAKHGVDINSIRGLVEVNLTSKTPQKDPDHGAKDKDKDKDKDKKEKGVFTPQILRKNAEDMVVLEMMKIWQEAKPNYCATQDVDFPALLEIAYAIASRKGWKQASVVADKEYAVLESWKKIVSFVVSGEDKFFKKLTIDGIANPKNFQKIEEAMRQVTQQINGFDMDKYQSEQTMKNLGIK